MSSLFASKALRVVSPLVALTKPQVTNPFFRVTFYTTSAEVENLCCLLYSPGICSGGASLIHHSAP